MVCKALDPQCVGGRSIFRSKVRIPITLLQVLAVGVGSTELNHLKVDVPVSDVDLRHRPPVSVLHLRFQGNGLAKNQSLQGLG